MGFVVEVERRFRATQGLVSPVRAARGLPGIPPGEGVEVAVKAGVAFDDGQLTELPTPTRADRAVGNPAQPPTRPGAFRGRSCPGQQ
jgi:hypothetical protein